MRAAFETLVPAHRAGPIAAVTAGWEEREAEDQELREHVGRPIVNLGIWARVERIFEEDQGLLAAMRRRHDTLRSVQELYRLRLSGLMDATHELFRRAGDEALLAPERVDALAMVRQLDQQHQARVAQIHAEFEARFRPRERTAVQHHRRELEGLLGDAPCLLVAGGHIAVLLHRLRLFDVFGLYGDRPVIAWSAGAMALCQRIVLFHDTPPQGSSWAEVMEAGFGLVPDLVALPHARKRLHTDDTRNVQVMARRFAPAWCALLDDGSRIEWNGRLWSARPGSSRLGEDGSVVEVGA
ncbi:MAG TPA: hypothetical protein VFT55_17700 [Planctomycetota bacterium]|nr:hypothetical protein [Planctomycetota bacterium]